MIHCPEQAGSFPALHSILRGDDLGHLIYRDFGLLASGPIRLIQSGLNDHYALPTHDGDFVIRAYRSGWRSNSETTWELELVDHLARNKAPVAGCVRCIDGSWFAKVQAVEGIRQVAVFRRAPGLYTHFGNNGRNRISPADCAEQFGRSMAEIHRVADTFETTYVRFPLDLEHLLDRPFQVIARAFPHRIAEVEGLRRLIVQLRLLIDVDRLQLDWGPCHGDMTGGNSTFWNDQIIHFDFDCAGYGWRTYELGVFFWSMSINGHGAEVWEHFIRGYSAHRSLPITELSLMNVFAGVRIIWLMGLWCANAHVFGSAKLHDDYFDRELTRANEFYKEALCTR